MKVKIFILLSLLGCIFCKQMNSQSMVPNIIPPTPQSQSFLKYGDYPVSLFTGLVDISIPLYELEYRGYRLPISLKFHGSGERASDNFRVYGKGWTLFPNGEISRTIYNKPDECADFARVNLNNYANPCGAKYMLLGFTTYQDYDITPDVFTCSLPNQESFQFTISRKNGQLEISKSTKKRVLVEVIQTTNHKIDAFKVTDDNGYVYNFRQTETTIFTTDSYTSGWKLNSIVFPQMNDSITFSYELFKQTPENEESNTVRKLSFDPGSVAHPNTFTDDFIREMSSYFTVHMLLVKEIKYGNNTVNFIYLDKTLVPQIQKKYLQTISFSNLDYKYLFTADEKLEYIEKKSVDETLGQKYLFEYSPGFIGFLNKNSDSWGFCNNENAGMEPLNFPGSWRAFPSFPIKFDDRHQSVWYGHGKYMEYFFTQCANGTPTVVQQRIYTPGALKEFEIGFGAGGHSPAYHGVLTKITYPTGGYTIFHYEQNMFGNNNRYGTTQFNNFFFPTGKHEMESKPAGGARIEGIVNYSNDGKIASQRWFRYGINECGYGVAPVIPSAHTYMRTMFDGRERQYHFSKDNFIDLLGGRPPVYYTEVTEYFGGETELFTSKNLDHKKIYNYKIDSFQIAQTLSTPLIYGGSPVVVDNYVMPEYRRWYKNFSCANGLLEKERYFVKGSDKPIKEVIYNWLVTSSGIINIPVLELCNSRPVYECCSNNWQVFREYPQLFEFTSSHLNSKVTKNYVDDNTFIEDTENYDYNTFDYITKKSQINSDLKENTYFYRYPLDYSLIVAPYINNLVAKNRVNEPIETQNWVDGKCVNATLTKYSDNLTEYQEIYKLNTEQPLSFSTSSPPYNTLFPDLSSVPFKASYDKEATIHYDANHNIKEVVKIDGTTSYIWGYNNQYPVAKIEGNMTYGEITAAAGTFLDQLDDGLNPAQFASVNKSIRAALPTCMVTTFTYKPLVGMTSSTDQKGITTYYEYDTFGRLKYIKNDDNQILKAYEYHYKQ